MLKFFRTIRRRLLDSGKVKSYVLYAIGEILLVVIGILMALQVNNWNENRKQEQRFRVTLEQIHTSIKEDTEIAHFVLNKQQQQIDLIDQVLTDPDQFNPYSLLYILFYLDTKPRLYSSETKHLLSALEFNPNNTRQNELAKQITSYVNNESWDFSKDQWAAKNFIIPLLEEAGIPAYPSSFAYSALWDFKNVDTTFFSEQHLLTARALLKTTMFRSALKSLKVVKQELSAAALNNSISDGQSIINAIKAYYPEVRLRFDDMGILGSAFDTGFNQSIPMTLTNAQEGIWEIDTYLKQGIVKFRTRNSWNQNWGGDTFPKGTTVWYGNDIQVEAGNYHIVLNLTQNTYEFIKKEN